MKKSKYCIIFSIAIICLLGLIFFKNKNYEEIYFEDYMEYYNSNEPFVLFVGSDQCSHCTLFKKTATRLVKKNDIEIYYIDIEKLTEKEYAHINSHFSVPSTPTTLIIKDKEEIGRIDGAKSYEDSMEILKKNNIIKE